MTEDVLADRPDEPALTLDLTKQGEQLTFFGDADPTAPRVVVEVRMAPGASVPEAHSHPWQSETFRIVSGRMVARVDGEERSVEAGGTCVVEPGQVHTFANGSATEPLVMQVTVEPALHFYWFLSESAKSAIRGGGSWRDMSLLEAGYILQQMGREYRIAGMPFALQRLLCGALAVAARLFGRTRRIAPREAPSVRAAPETGAHRREGA